MQTPPLPISILTGFLGAGKTTLLSKLLDDPDLKNTAVIINEFGEVGLDHLLVEASNEGIVELQGGCVCCTIRGDLVNTLEDLLARRDAGTIPPFTRLVVETTGLADPAPILHTVMHQPWLLHRLRLESVITVIDAANGLQTLDAHPEATKQAAVADRLVTTKTDLQDGQSALNALTARLQALNPGAVILDAAKGEATAGRLFDAGLYDPATKSVDVNRWLKPDAYPDAKAPGNTHEHTHAHDVNRHDDHIRAFCLTHNGPVSITALELFLDLLRERFGEKLLRLKGIVELVDEPQCPLILHGVQHIFHPPVRLPAWPEGTRQTRIVCILNDVDPLAVQALFDALAEAPKDSAPEAGQIMSALSPENPLAPGGKPFRPK